MRAATRKSGIGYEPITEEEKELLNTHDEIVKVGDKLAYLGSYNAGESRSRAQALRKRNPVKLGELEKALKTLARLRRMAAAEHEED